MRAGSADHFTTVTSEGALLPIDLLQRIVEGERDLEGLTPDSYHLSGERLNEAISRSWNRLLGAWTAFEDARNHTPPDEPGTSLARERWLLPLFQELGYGRLHTAKALELDGKTYPVSHIWERAPVHLVGFNVDLDRRARGLAGAARASPHSLVQEFLNRSQDHLWGFVSNGLRLRVLRDNASLTRQAYVEFDLEALMRGEVYSDFVLLWLLCHESRVEGDPETCWLERWSQDATQRGTRALDRLRDGVERAIEALGQGFLAHLRNGDLRERLRSGTLSKDDYYRQLLRLIYRLIFLFTAEDRGLLRAPGGSPDAWDRYLRYYSSQRLRELAGKRRGGRHPDLYRMLRVVMDALGTEEACAELALPGLGSFLWSKEALPDLTTCEIANRDLLQAVRALAFTEDAPVLRAVDYKNLGPEELGSVYESLLELHPEIHLEAATFELKIAAGHERKTTGSYYTPTSLIQSLLETALDPVLDEVARDASAEEAERAILSLKACDPAVGSGHFLIAAAHRIARRLAAVRTGDEEPAPQTLRHALRDVIGHCIYGVDVNPMAVELCKVNLWLESLQPGKPLSFLDHRILCGNSLLGTTPAVLAKGIPDGAFDAIAGDDKRVASALKRQNRVERKGQRTLFKLLVRETAAAYGALSERVEELEELPDETWATVRRKERSYRSLTESGEYIRNQLLANAWCAAFVWPKTTGAPTPITTEILRRLRENAEQVPQSVREDIARLADRYRFFHWHLGFPDVFAIPAEGETPENPLTGWSGGFDVVLGNPPWEHTELKEKEWFGERAPDIARMPGVRRKRKIAALKVEDPGLYRAYVEAKRGHDAVSHIIRASGRYPLCARGRINTYAIFAELNRNLVGSTGRVGCIVPSGIATDDTTKYFFQDLIEQRQLASLYDFENREGIFEGVHRSYKFCLLTLAGRRRSASEGAEFAFFLHSTAELRDEARRFHLTAVEIALLNPNTRTCPIFRTRRDAELTKAIYRRVPILLKEGPPEDNPWEVSFRQGLFNMTTDSGLFRTQHELDAEGWRLQGNLFHRDGRRYLPLYEAKMVHHFDHRFGDYADLPPESKSTQLPDVPVERKQDPNYAPLPRYWVPEEEVKARLEGRWDRGWLLGWRDITNTTNERTVIASVAPRVACDNGFLLMLPSEPARIVSGMLANLNTLALDYAARQKVGGTHVKYFTMKQLPVLPPIICSQPLLWTGGSNGSEWFLSRVLELTYTAWDLQTFARDSGYDGPPFRWDDERRFLLRCELDAGFFHLYLGALADWRESGSPELLEAFPAPRDAVEYIFETFPIVRSNDEKAHSEYRTKRVVLEIYDEIQRAIETGEPYRTRLDPRPANLRASHETPLAPVAVSPFRRVRPSREEKYRTCVPMLTLMAAASDFGEQQAPEFVDWVTVPSGRPLKRGMLVAQVVGRSMEPTIPDGAYCLFKRPVLGTRQGMVMLVQHHDIYDPETGGTYTVKRYVSKKAHDDDGSWRHAEVRLQPDNPAFQPMVLHEASAGEVRAIAEFLEVVSLEPPTESD